MTKTTITSVDFAAFAAFAKGFAGSFIQVDTKVDKRGVETVSMRVPRFEGETFKTFLDHLDGSERLDTDGNGIEKVALTKVEKGYLSSIFAACSKAAMEFGDSVAGRVTFTWKDGGLLKTTAAFSRAAEPAEAPVS